MNGPRTTWNAANQLEAVCSNSVCVVSNAYDYMNRRVLKVTPAATHTFIYDGWNLAQETVATTSDTSTNTYVWGKDLSGTMQGAGGVGGLLAVSLNGTWYFPACDANGNITAYVNESGAIAAEYTYDAFGDTINSSGSTADVFAYRFSTKYYDSEIGLYYYGLRFYSPSLHRWLNRDPIEEQGGFNVYGFGGNDGVNNVDLLGLKVTVVVLGDSISHGTESMGRIYKGYVDFLSIDDVEETTMLGGAGQKVGDIKRKYNDPSGKCRDKVAILAMMGMNDALSLANDNGKSEAIRGGNYSLRYNGALAEWKELYSRVKTDFEKIDPKKQVLFVTVTTPSVAKTPNMRANYHGIINDINRFLGSLNQDMARTCKADGDWWSCTTADASKVRHTIGVDRLGNPDASMSDDGVHFLDSQAKQIADIVSGVVNKWVKKGGK